MPAQNTIGIIFRYFWVLCLGVTFVNWGVMRFRASKQIRLHPEKRETYRKLLRGFLFVSLPFWIIVGVGDMTGSTRSVFEYMDPRSGNPFVITAWAAQLAIMAFLAKWVVFNNGAETLCNHPGILRGDKNNPTVLKLMFGAGFIGICVITALACTGKLPNQTTPDTVENKTPETR